MLLQKKNNGGIAERDRISGVIFCCSSLMIAILADNYLSISQNIIKVYFSKTNTFINFCPFCGAKIKTEYI